jgi:hypothetical protein
MESVGDTATQNPGPELTGHEIRESTAALDIAFTLYHFSRFLQRSQHVLPPESNHRLQFQSRIIAYMDLLRRYEMKAFAFMGASIKRVLELRTLRIKWKPCI